MRARRGLHRIGRVAAASCRLDARSRRRPGVPAHRLVGSQGCAVDDIERVGRPYVSRHVRAIGSGDVPTRFGRRLLAQSRTRTFTLSLRRRAAGAGRVAAVIARRVDFGRWSRGRAEIVRRRCRMGRPRDRRCPLRSIPNALCRDQSGDPYEKDSDFAPRQGGAHSSGLRRPGGRTRSAGDEPASAPRGKGRRWLAARMIRRRASLNRTRTRDCARTHAIQSCSKHLGAGQTKRATRLAGPRRPHRTAPSG